MEIEYSSKEIEYLKIFYPFHLENNTYIGLTTMILSWCLAMLLNDSSSMAQHLKSHSLPKSKFRKILVENYYNSTWN